MQRDRDWLREGEAELRDAPDLLVGGHCRGAASRLFGSMARGNWSLGSDYDVLVGLRGTDGLRLVDRIGAFEALVHGDVQIFPYERPAWERMFDEHHVLLLEALEHGVPLFDRGGFAALRGRFAALRVQGVLTPVAGGWEIAPKS